MTRLQIEIILGIIMVLATSVILIYVGLTEETRMARFVLGQQAQAIEVGASLFADACADCHGPKGEGVPGLAPALNDAFFFSDRMDEVGWGGTQEDYIIAVVSSGRITSTRPQYVGGGTPAMPAWSEHFGGPLRNDQIQMIAAFVMNWESTAGEITPPVVVGEPAGRDITIELPEGDAQRGELLAAAQGCVACHISTPTGPTWEPTAQEPGMGERADLRINQADYTGTAEDGYQYLFESIVLPNIYVVEGYSPIMPEGYDTTLTQQDVADLIEYMLTYR
jgi:mono/diheme cytochrome c family protein